MQNNNSIWHFFASVKLALVTLFLIAVTSIIGTIIPQKEAFDWYVSTYGAKTAQLFAVLDIPDMYNSWWFTALLFLLSFNLVICSIDRFPGVWKQVTADGLKVNEERIAKMSTRQKWHLKGSAADTVVHLGNKLNNLGWKHTSRESDDSIILFSQKGAWTRTGVYLVHSSILIIFVGAIIGYLLGFKGSVVIPETMERDRVVLYGSNEIVDLDFQIRCNSFIIEFYPNGMPKEYTSSLSILENDKEVLTKTIEVNSPLTYKGITFYQSSYEAYQDFVITVTNATSGNEKSFIIPFQKQTEWPEEGVSFGVINAKAIGQSIVSSKVWFSDNKSAPGVQWADDGTTVTFTREDQDYTVSAKQMYATGLQVAKDPGVWWVYIGCIIMLIGLYVAFFMSHRRIWIVLSESQNGSTLVTLAGSANKNRPGFKRVFEDLYNKLAEDSDK